MVYKKYKDYKLDIIEMIFKEDEPYIILPLIKDLEMQNRITPSQAVQLTSIYYNAEIYKLDRAPIANELANDLVYDTEIMVFEGKIIAAYLPRRGVVTLR